MRKLLTGLVAVAMVTVFSAGSAAAYKINDNHEIGGYMQYWLLLSETSSVAKEYNNKTRPAGANEVDETTFGFKQRRGFVWFSGDLADGAAYYSVLLALPGDSVWAESFYMGFNFLDGALKLQVGQLSPFVTYESSLTSASKLKNIERAMVTREVQSNIYALSDETEDRGLQLIYSPSDAFKVYFSATNGTGVTSSIGGRAEVGGDFRDGAVMSNGIGEAALGLGAVGTFADGAFRLNASYILNSHEDVYAVGGDKNKPVGVTVARNAYSIGTKVALEKLVGIGLWFDAELAGLIADEDDTLIPGQEWGGFYARLGYYIMPWLEGVVRYESMGHKANKDADTETTQGVAVTLNYYLGSTFKSQLEFATKMLDEDFHPDADDPATVRAMFQVKF